MYNSVYISVVVTYIFFPVLAWPIAHCPLSIVHCSLPIAHRTLYMVQYLSLYWPGPLPFAIFIDAKNVCLEQIVKDETFCVVLFFS